jgi:hypothetical protein
LPLSRPFEPSSQCERLKSFAQATALLGAFGSPYHSRPNGSASEIRSKPRFIFCMAVFCKGGISWSSHR